jgi:hypothetical protein
MAKGQSLRRAHKKRYFVASRLEGAAETIGQLNHGDEICGLTCGQFSMIDILEHMLNEAGGPADVFVSTWTAGIYDVERAASLASNGNIRSIRWLMDKALFSKSPTYSGPMIEAFGLDAFRDTSVHAKVTLVASDTKRMVCRSSMNLNKNLKTEQFDISVCDEAHGFFLGWADELWAAAEPKADVEHVFKAVWDRYTATRGNPPESAWPSLRDFTKTLPSAAGAARRLGTA